MLDHAINDMQQFAHHRTQNHAIGFATCGQARRKLFEFGVSAHHRDGGHVQGRANARFAHFRQPRSPSHRAARFVVRWRQASIRPHRLGRGVAGQIIEFGHQFLRRHWANPRNGLSLSLSVKTWRPFKQGCTSCVGGCAPMMVVRRHVGLCPAVTQPGRTRVGCCQCFTLEKCHLSSAAQSSTANRVPATPV